MAIQHKSLAAGKWRQFSLAEQMGHIGSETSRALKWKDKDEMLYQNALTRALELLDLTIQDPRWRKRLKELLRVREVLGDVILGGKEYKSSLADLNRYFFHFAYAVRARH